MGKEFAILEYTFLSRTMAEWNNSMLLTAHNTLHVAYTFLLLNKNYVWTTHFNMHNWYPVLLRHQKPISNSVVRKRLNFSLSDQTMSQEK